MSENHITTRKNWIFSRESLSLIVYQSTRNFTLIPKMYVFISLPWIFDELHFKSRRFLSISTIAQFGQIVVVTSPLFQKISQIGHSLSAFSSFFVLCAFSSFHFSQKWRHLYGQKWQMAALNSIKMTNLDESNVAICDVIFCLSKNHLLDPRN